MILAGKLENCDAFIIQLKTARGLKGDSPVDCVSLHEIRPVRANYKSSEEYAPMIHVLNRNKNISILALSFNDVTVTISRDENNNKEKRMRDSDSESEIRAKTILLEAERNFASVVTDLAYFVMVK